MSVGGWNNVMDVLKASSQLLADTLDGNADSVARGLDRTHTEVASILTYNDENSQSFTEERIWRAIGLAYYSARKDYRLIREFPTGKGFADIVFLPLPHTRKPALVVGLNMTSLSVRRSGRSAIGIIHRRLRGMWARFCWSALTMTGKIRTNRTAA